MQFEYDRRYESHGIGEFQRSDFKTIGENVIFEDGVKVFHPDRISIGENVYIGHYTILKGYHQGYMSIGDHTWIGQGCFLHSAGTITIGAAVGIGPNVTILTSVHEEGPLGEPVLFGRLRFGEVTVEDGCDIGVGAILLPGVRIGEGAIIGAGSVVTKEVPAFSVAAGNPARVLRDRKSHEEG
jgi:acetyltransferase-like isoleucine patch superfamily enzyme